MAINHRLFLLIDPPASAEDGERKASLLNRMLARLCKPGDAAWQFEADESGALHYGDAMGSFQLPNVPNPSGDKRDFMVMTGGFSLDYFGRVADTATLADRTVYILTYRTREGRAWRTTTAGYATEHDVRVAMRHAIDAGAKDAGYQLIVINKPYTWGEVRTAD